MDLGHSKGTVFVGDLGELGFGGEMSGWLVFRSFDSEPMAPSMEKHDICTHMNG